MGANKYVADVVPRICPSLADGAHVGILCGEAPEAAQVDGRDTGKEGAGRGGSLSLGIALPGAMWDPKKTRLPWP